MGNKRAWFMILAVGAALLASWRPIQFTARLLLAAFHHGASPSQTAEHLFHAVSIQPNACKHFKKQYGSYIDDRFALEAITRRHAERLPLSQTLNPAIMTEKRFLQTYRDNIYVHRLFSPDPAFTRAGRWENLDPPSLRLLADPAMNPLSETILRQLKPTFSPPFPALLAEYLEWRGNQALAVRVRGIFSLPPSAVVSHRGDAESLRFLAAFLESRDVLKSRDIGPNLIPGGALDQPGDFQTRWTPSVMAGPPHFAPGSYVAGSEHRPETGGRIRVLGFYSDPSAGPSPARGGAWFHKTIPLGQAVYLFAFDYYTGAGAEKPSFYMAPGTAENFLPPSPGAWRTAVLILDNTSQTLRAVKPLIRLWGTGMLWADNVRLSEIAALNKHLPATGRLWILPPRHPGGQTPPNGEPAPREPAP